MLDVELGDAHVDDPWDPAATPIVVVCAGVKSILDVGATLERLETLSVPVLGYALMQRVAHVMYERLQDARMRLLDLYGSPS